MIKSLLFSVLVFFQAVILFSATAKVEDCPDPNCCSGRGDRPTCYRTVDPCLERCPRVCPCGFPAYCNTIERFWPVCKIGEPEGMEEGCYQRDMSCDQFLAAIDECADPCCWDPDLLWLVCGSVCGGKE